jgi:PKD domain/Bacterial Ig domain
VSLRRVVPLLTAIGCLGFAAPAMATTWTVDPLRPNTGTCDLASSACKTITQANTAAKTGDTILIKDGTFAEKPLVFLQKNLTIKAEHPGQVQVTSAGGDAGDPVITIGPGDDGSPNGAGDGSGVDGLIVTAGATAGPAIKINAVNVQLKDSTFQHPGGTSGADDAVVLGDSDVDTGQTSLTRVTVVQNSGSTGAVTASNLLTISDSAIFSTKGYAVRFDGGIGAPGVANTLVRSLASTSATEGNAVEVASGTQATRVILSIDSSIMSGGASGAGILAQPSKFVDTDSQDISVNVTHGTIAGGGKSAIADAEPAMEQLLFAPGDVFIAFDRSIVHGPAQALSGAPPAADETTASVDIVRSDTDVAPSTGITVGGSTNTKDKLLFVNPNIGNFHLRGDAPVIDKGGARGPGESTTDIDGDPRVVGVASDIGADEFQNHAPSARFTANATTISQRQTITFDAAPSTDPDLGDRIAEYRWDFGDGATAATGLAQVTHSYPNVGTFEVKLVAVDLHGFTSEVRSLTVSVATARSLKGDRPQISIKTPKSGARISRARRLVLTGRVSDDDGIRRVEIALRLVKRSNASAAAKRCLFVSGTRLTRRSCGQAPLLRATLDGNTWRYRAPRGLHLPPGLYIARVRATDKRGVASRTAHRTFRIR